LSPALNDGAQSSVLPQPSSASGEGAKHNLKFAMTTQKSYNVLFLCTGNSARSVMSEALITTMGNGRYKGFSAGSHPTGRINPFAIEIIAPTGYDTSQLRSKSWDEFAGDTAKKMDFIITVCDNAAGETCPYWPGHPATAHWGYEDPAAVEGSDEEKRAAFKKVFAQIAVRTRLFVALPIESMDHAAISKELTAIGNATIIDA
jgi:arsenate reductase (thioredoxin)